jgi:hypothetical protein
LGEIERRSSDNRVVRPARKLNNRKITGTSSEKESTTENPFRETDNPEVYKSIPSQEVTMDAGPPLGLWFWCWECHSITIDVCKEVPKEHCGDEPLEKCMDMAREN